VAGTTTSEWLLAQFEDNRGRAGKRDVHIARHLFDLIDDHFDYCGLCRGNRMPRAFRWVPPVPVGTQHVRDDFRKGPEYPSAGLGARSARA
jgi:hypothetical protein